MLLYSVGPGLSVLDGTGGHSRKPEVRVIGKLAHAGWSHTRTVLGQGGGGGVIDSMPQTRKSKFRELP